MKIGIIGIGVVGSAVASGLRDLGHSMFLHDIKYKSSIKDVLKTDVCFICVPTPSIKEGECDTSIVFEVIKNLNDLKYSGIVAIKSTVEPGTTKKMQGLFPDLEICFVPEFLRERCAISDFTDNHDICIIGTDKEHVYEKVKQSHGDYPKEFVKLSSTEAEITKYFNNIYNATLITFANSFYEICKSLDINYKNIKKAISKRDHIDGRYLDCNENLRGFGGVCLPKDTLAIAQLVKKLNLDIDFFDILLKENLKYKTTVLEGMREE